MSAEVTIEQMNEAIALFMGFIRRNAENKYKSSKLGHDYFIDDKGKFKGYTHSLEYHASWDWIMPVVYKIKKLTETETSVVAKHYMRGRYKPIENELRNINIINVHYCVYQFITWLNQQKQNDDPNK